MYNIFIIKHENHCKYVTYLPFFRVRCFLELKHFYIRIQNYNVKYLKKLPKYSISDVTGALGLERYPYRVQISTVIFKWVFIRGVIKKFVDCLYKIKLLSVHQ